MNLAATRANMMNRTRHQAEAEGFRRYAQAIQAGQGLLGQAGSLLGRSSDAARMGMAGLAGEQQLQALPLHSFLTSSNMNMGGAAAALNMLNSAGALAGSGIAGVNAAVTGTGNAANQSAAAAHAQGERADGLPGAEGGDAGDLGALLLGQGDSDGMTEGRT